MSKIAAAVSALLLAGSLTCVVPHAAFAQTCVQGPQGLVSWWPAEGNASDVIDGNTGSLSGAVAFPAARVGLGFDFTPGGHVVVNHNNNLNVNAPGFTAEFWMKGIHNQPEALYNVLDKAHDGSDGAGWTFQGDSGPGTMSFLIGGLPGNNFATAFVGIDLLNGQFHHVAGTWDGTTVRIYVDGLPYGTAALTTPKNNTRPLRIGRWQFGRQFRGVVDELGIYARALSQAEIQAIVQAGAAGKCSPCGNGELNPGEQCDDGNNLGGDCCAPTCQAEPGGSPCTDDGVVCTLDQCNGRGQCVHPSDGTCGCEPQPADAITWWPAEGNASDVIDGNPGTLNGTVAFPAARVGLGFDFNPGGHVFVNHNNNLNVNAPGFTAEFWMKGVHNQPEALYNVLDKAHDGSDGAGWTFQGNSGPGTMSFLIGGLPGNNFATAFVGIDLLNGQFHHVAGTWGGTTVRIYVDGLPYGTAPLTTPKNNTRPLRIGRWQFGRQFRGIVDELTVYGRALSAGEIEAIWSAGCQGKCRAAAGPCGNGVIGAGETCDDGNSVSGDGCSASCMLEPGWRCPCQPSVCSEACGNGIPTPSERCDEGTDNGSNASCCTAACQLRAPGAECRPSAGVCDLADTCTGTTGSCPPDAKSTALCRAADGDCDAGESCDGDSNDCPADGFAPAATVCRAAAGICDPVETCTGSSTACPADAKSTAVCRAADGDCDAGESCDGAGDDCPADGFAPAATVCRVAAGICDPVETCTGSSTACPADAKSTAVCRVADGDCDVGESCDGTADDCPPDTFQPSGVPCRAAAGDCDAAESCTGAAPQCPADTLHPAAMICRPAADQCDATESCDGVSVACPADAAQPNGTGCDDADPCTTADACSSGTCAGTPDPQACAEDDDGDGIENAADACPNTAGLADRQGCPFGDANLVELHVVDQAKSGACPGGAGSCKSPISGAQVRVFDRNDPVFRATYGTKNPSGTVYDQVFENDVGRVGACTTDATGRCTAGEETVGDFLVIVRYVDAGTGSVVYTGKPKSPSDFVDTNGDTIGDLATKDFQILKVIKKNGAVQWSGGSKVVVNGSYLEIVHPDVAIWEDVVGGFVYPFIFASDSTWTVDVCARVPSGYQIAGVYDANGDLLPSAGCVQTLVANETAVVAFAVVEVGSPEPRLRGRLRIKGGHTTKTRKSVRFDVRGLRKYRGHERVATIDQQVCAAAEG